MKSGKIVNDDYPTIHFDEKARVWRGTVNLGGIKKQIGLHDTRESAIAKYEQIYEHKEFYINKFNKENSPAPYEKSTRCKIKEPENHTQIKELFNRRQELEEEITKINAEMSALNQENLNNGKGVYWSEGEINAMFVQIDAGDKWIDTPLGIVPAVDIKKGSFFVPYACNNSSIVEHSSKVLGVTKQIKSVENCKYHPNARVQGKRVPLDMLMVEQNIGRYLTRHEVVYHIDGDDLNNQLDNLMLFDDLKAKAFYVGLVKLEERGVTRKAFEEAMVEHYNCVLTCATKLNVSHVTLHRYYPDICDTRSVLKGSFLTGDRLKDCIYAVAEMFRLKINKKEEGVVCEELVSIKAEMARICGSFRMPKGQYDDVIKYAFDKQLSYLTGVERIVN
jgi:hypothetical protein